METNTNQREHAAKTRRHRLNQQKPKQEIFNIIKCGDKKKTKKTKTRNDQFTHTGSGSGGEATWEQ